MDFQDFLLSIVLSLFIHKVSSKHDRDTKAFKLNLSLMLLIFNTRIISVCKDVGEFYIIFTFRFSFWTLFERKITSRRLRSLIVLSIMNNYEHRTKKTYRKIPKMSPSIYKPPPRGGGGLYLEIALKYKVKQSKNGKFPSICKASLIDFETQISLHR